MLFLSFNEKDKDNLANNNVIQKVNGQIFYNKEMSDTVYVFSDKGDYLKSYFINFSGKNVPQEYKFDFEKLLYDDKEKLYAYLDDCPMVCDSVFLIPITLKAKRGLVYYDMKNKIEENKKG